MEERIPGGQSDSRSRRPLKLIVLMPVFRDWNWASKVCAQLDDELSRRPEVEASVVLVDDGSPDGLAGWSPLRLRAIRRISALRLRRNLGHQRAIAMGLCHVHDEQPCDLVLVMDADGEDRAEDALRLLEQTRVAPGQIVFAERRRRLETFVFRAGYWMYRGLHRALTGVPVRVGNFSAIPFSAVSRLVSMSELWNHYAGAVFRSKLAYTLLPTDRGRRLGGRSHMNLIDLVVHGISGIATFHDVVSTRILVANVAAFALVALALAIVVAIRLGTDLAIPGWATYSAGLLLVLLVLLGSVSFGLVFLLVTSRAQMTFVPARDYRIYVAGVDELQQAPP